MSFKLAINSCILAAFLSIPQGAFSDDLNITISKYGDLAYIEQGEINIAATFNESENERLKRCCQLASCSLGGGPNAPTGYFCRSINSCWKQFQICMGDILPESTNASDLNIAD